MLDRRGQWQGRLHVQVSWSELVLRPLLQRQGGQATCYSREKTLIIVRQCIRSVHDMLRFQRNVIQKSAEPPLRAGGFCLAHGGWAGRAS